MREDDDEGGEDGDEDGTGMGCVVYPEKADAFETRKLRFERYQKEEALRRFRLTQGGGGDTSKRSLIEDEEEETWKRNSYFCRNPSNKAIQTASFRVIIRVHSGCVL